MPRNCLVRKPFSDRFIGFHFARSGPVIKVTPKRGVVWISEQSAHGDQRRRTIPRRREAPPRNGSDPTSVKSGPICTEGTGCSEDRELLDFQSVALDNSNLADLAYTRSIDGQSNTELRFLHETGTAAAAAPLKAKHRGR